MPPPTSTDELSLSLEHVVRRARRELSPLRSLTLIRPHDEIRYTYDTDVHENEWLTPQAIALELRVDVASVYRAVRRGDLPAVRLSQYGALRIPRSALEPKEEN
jgi:hypothetical protein